MVPYFVVASISHIINENNYWRSEIIIACVAATENASNTVTMNTPTDGVSRKMKWNYKLCVD